MKLTFRAGINIFMITFLMLNVLSCKNIKNKNVKELTNKLSFSDSVKLNIISEEQEYIKDSIQNASIKKFSVKKIQGSHKYGGNTRIKYKSLHQLLNETIKKSKKEMWTDIELSETIDTYKKGFKGGALFLDIERGTIGHANMEYYTLILQNLKEKEVMRHVFKPDIPNTPIDNDFWWNTGVVNIPQLIEYPFYVYVIDGLTSDKYKFEVIPSK